MTCHSKVKGQLTVDTSLQANQDLKRQRIKRLVSMSAPEAFLPLPSFVVYEEVPEFSLSIH